MGPSLEPNRIYLGDALQLLGELSEASVDLALTDPPYFLEGLDSGWDSERVKRRTRGQAVGHLPAGMRFDPSQGRALQAWYREVARGVFRVLKPGGFFLSFSSPRLLHRMAMAVEEAGFHIRDTFIWLYQGGQAKASSLERYVEREERPRLLGWKTPQVRGNYEPIVVAQKPPQGPLVRNFLRHGVGLFNLKERLQGGYFPSNVLQTEPIPGVPPIFLVPKPGKGEKGEWNDHPTVKPVELLRFLIRLTTAKGALVLDPFIGTGSTALAALLEGRRFIGFELDPHYHALAQRRLARLGKGEKAEAENVEAQPLFSLLPEQG